MPPIRIDAQIQTDDCRFSGRLQPDSGRFGGVQAYSCLHGHQTAPRHPQIGQRKQRVQLRSILLQPAVAHLDVPKLALDHPKRILVRLYADLP